MRNSLKLLTPLSVIALAACSAESDYADTSPAAGESAFEERASLAVDASAQADAYQTISSGSDLTVPVGEADIPLTLPKMAYVFDFGFRLAGEAIAPLQQKHADMCEAQGPYACRIVSLHRTGEDEDEIRGELQLAVASDKARGFGALLSGAAEAADAEVFRANIQGEDLSRSINDTEARLRSRIVLRDRLMEVLRTRTGKIEDLVQAERQVAAVNEEIDRAQSWLREQQGRVAFSRMTLTYESATPGASILRPVEGALGALGTIFGGLAAVLIVLGSLAIPLLAGALGIRALRRRYWPAVGKA